MVMISMHSAGVRYLLRSGWIRSKRCRRRVMVVFSQARHHSTGNLHLLGKGLLILQHLIHDFSAEIQLRRHMLLSSINIRNTRKQQINTLSHTRLGIILTLTKSIHRIQDKLGLHRGLRRSHDESDGEMEAERAQKRCSHPISTRT